MAPRGAPEVPAHQMWTKSDIKLDETKETVPVRIHVYDLTRGMARRVSPMLLPTGHQIEGIWHSALVIRDFEYFFGYGIHKMEAGKTMFGTPSLVLEMGTTTGSREDFEEVLVGMTKGLFGNTDYGIIYHNCNHFSHTAAQLLTGKLEGLPDDIMGQAERLLDTRIGTWLSPLLSKMDDRLAVAVLAERAAFSAVGLSWLWPAMSTSQTAALAAAKAILLTGAAATQIIAGVAVSMTMTMTEMAAAALTRGSTTQVFVPPEQWKTKSSLVVVRHSPSGAASVSVMDSPVSVIVTDLPSTLIVSAPVSDMSMSKSLLPAMEGLASSLIVTASASSSNLPQGLMLPV